MGNIQAFQQHKNQVLYYDTKRDIDAQSWVAELFLRGLGYTTEKKMIERQADEYSALSISYLPPDFHFNFNTKHSFWIILTQCKNEEKQNDSQMKNYSIQMFHVALELYFHSKYFPI